MHLFFSLLALSNPLFYGGNPIPEPILEDFFFNTAIGDEFDIPERIVKETQELNSEDEYQPTIDFKWQYIGSLYNDFHVVRAYRWESGCLGKFSAILILKREGEILKIIDVVAGGDRHSSMICEDCQIHGNTIVFHQGATKGSIVDKALELYPEINEIYTASAKKGICYGEAGYFGEYKKAAEITPEGMTKEIILLEFSPCEGCKEVEEIYERDGLKGVALDLLTDA